MSLKFKKGFAFSLLAITAILFIGILAAKGETPEFRVLNRYYNCNPTPGATPTWCVTPVVVSVSGGSVTAHINNAGVSVLDVVATNANGQGILGTSAVTVYACPGSTQSDFGPQVYTYTAASGANPVTIIRYFNGVQLGPKTILQPQGSLIDDSIYNLTAGDVIEASGNTLVTFTHTERESPL